MTDPGIWMRAALRQARCGEGLTRPNPPVGAVVVRNGRIVGRGYHRKAGGPHAEPYALRQAGDQARGADLYVTLEPCCSTGRTPPCTAAILKSGVRRVFVACRDSNPKHRGRGVRLLRRAGVEVIENICRAEAEELAAPFFRWISEKRPYLTLKLGLSLDGRVADAHGRSRWITGPQARAHVQELRRKSDGILVGAETVVRDDPSLLPRPPRGRHPYRIVVDATGRVPVRSRIFCDGAVSRTIMATTRRCPARLRRAWERAGAAVWTLRSDNGRVDLKALMTRLGELGVLRVLCEGGGELAGSLIAAGLADEMYWIYAGLVLGGAKGAVGSRLWNLAGAPAMRITEVTRLGADVCVRMKPLRKQGAWRCSPA